MSTQDRYFIYLCIIFSLLIYCVRTYGKTEIKNNMMQVHNDNLSGQWTDQDIEFKGTIFVKGDLFLGSVNHDITIYLLDDVMFKGENNETSFVRFMISPGRKLTICSKNGNHAMQFFNIGVRFPDLTKDKRSVLLQNVGIGGDQTADIAAPNIESIALVLQDDKSNFIPTKAEKIQIR